MSYTSVRRAILSAGLCSLALLSSCTNTPNLAGHGSTPQNTNRQDSTTDANDFDAQPLLEELRTPVPGGPPAAGSNRATQRSSAGSSAEQNGTRVQPLIEVESLHGMPKPASAGNVDDWPGGNGVEVSRHGEKNTGNSMGSDREESPIKVTRRMQPETREAVIDTATLVERSIRTLRRELLAKLETFADVDERTPDDAARLTKQNLEVRLIALHFVDGDSDVTELAPLLDAIGAPHYPGEVHTLLRAALYHDVGSEDLRDRALTGLRGAKSTSPFDLVAVELCSSIGHSGQRKRYDEYIFRPDQALHVYGELLNLHAIEASDGWHSKVRIEVFLVKGARVVDHRILKDFNALQPVPRERNFFGEIYRLPMLIHAGDYELRVVATDLNTEPQTIVQQRIPVRIQK